MEEYIKWLENKIEVCLEDKDLQREHWAFCQALKKYRELVLRQPLVSGQSEQFCKTDISNSSDVVRIERGWAGHFIGANRCMFSRNTLLAYNSIKIVVSTVGLMRYENKFETIGLNRYFETMAFHSNPTDTRYYDADVSKQVNFDSEWAIAEQDADDKANEMHEAVVSEITNRLLAGDTFPVTEW